MPKRRVIVLGSHAFYEPWKSILLDGQLKTWAENPEFITYHYFGIPKFGIFRKIDKVVWRLQWHSNFGKIFLLFIRVFQNFSRKTIPAVVNKWNFFLEKEILEVQLADYDVNMGRKTQAIIEYINKFEFDFLVMTSSSSYLNLKKIEAEINSLPKSNVVAGRIIETQNMKFPSGTFRIFSKDVIKILSKNIQELKRWQPEDLAIGKLLANENLIYINLSSLNIDSIQSLDNLSLDELVETCHFRLTSGTLNKRRDVEIMLALHNRFLTNS
jgi:hypothetical protein